LAAIEGSHCDAHLSKHFTQIELHTQLLVSLSFIHPIHDHTITRIQIATIASSNCAARAALCRADFRSGELRAWMNCADDRELL
jgi:hypothetical protein